jgi:hypothetical protein
MVFEKTPDGVGCSFQQQSRQQTQKTFTKALQIFLEKIARLYHSINNR